MKIPLLLVFFFLTPYLYSQIKEIELSLKFHDGNGPFEYENFPIKWNDTSIAFKNTYPQVKGIPRNLKEIKRGIICFDFIQYVYQNFIEGKISDSNFLGIKKILGSHFQENLLVKDNIKCFVNVLSGKNKNNEQVCIIDANNNYDFGDDVIFKPLDDNLPDEILNRDLKKISAQRFLNGKVINDSVSILVTKRGSSLRYGIAQYATVDMYVDNKKYKLAICPLYFHSRSWIETQLVLLDDSLKTKTAAQNLIVNKGEFFEIGGNIYKFTGVIITKNLLLLKKISSSNQFSAQAGFHAPPFTGNNLQTGMDISLQMYKGKYVLIDFWGTWCAPCRAQIPSLVKIYNLTDTSRFALLSIASSDYLDSLKKVLVQENMTWPQLLSDKITAEYNVSAFPTNILINPAGVIIAKDLSMDDLKQKLSSLGLITDD